MSAAKRGRRRIAAEGPDKVLGKKETEGAQKVTRSAPGKEGEERRMDAQPRVLSNVRLTKNEGDC